MKKISLFIVFALFAIITSFAQLNVQVYGSYLMNLNKDFKGNTTGVGLRLEYEKPGSSISYFAGYAYASPVSTKKVLQATAMSNQADEDFVNVTAIYKLPMNRVEAGMRYYLTGDVGNYHGVNIFMDIKGEYVFFKNIPKYSYYDQDQYTLGVYPDEKINEDGSPKHFTDIYAGLGAGIEVNIGPGNVFFQTGISLPITKTYIDGSTSDVGSMSPIPLNFNIGYKIPLGRTEK